jgi:hypothetical protein
MALLNDQMPITPESVAEGIEVPADVKEAYDRVVLAGMKLMFGDKTHQMALSQLKGEGPLSVRLGRAIANMVVTFFNESNNTIPPSVLIPAGTYLIAQAADFLRQAQMDEVSNKAIADAMQVMVEEVVRKFGGNTQKMYQLLNQYGAPRNG